MLWLKWLPRLLCGLVIVGLVIAVIGERRHSDKLAVRVGELSQARANDAQRFKDAAEQAAREQRANLAIVQEKQERISAEVVGDYKSKLADLRASFDRLRGASQADPGGADAGGVPAIPVAAERIDDPAARFACEADALQLSALQEWNRKQAEVDPSPAPQRNYFVGE